MHSGAFSLKPFCSDCLFPWVPVCMPPKGTWSASHPAALAAMKARGQVAAVAAKPIDAVAASAPDLSEGDIRKAAAFRVKYRVLTDAGKLKRRLAIKLLGVNPYNRGGVYPQGDVVKQLGVSLARKGFLQEEADHMGVCVQQPPPEHAIDFSTRVAVDQMDSQARAAVAVTTFSAYNKARCQGQSGLESCFDSEANVLYGLLSHNHLLLVLLCWLGGAVWELNDEEKKLLEPVLDSRGGLDLAAAAQTDKFAELHTTIRDGLLLEVLSWKIMTEEPDACCLISSALNSANALALRTTEITAIKVLTGEIALQMKLSGDSRKIDFLRVKANLRSQLDSIVDEAEFQELFEFVINLGANEGPFVNDLIEFGQRFVNQKVRQLRLSAFTIINKMKDHFPKLKIAALKRAYRKNPSYGFCPSPEPKFATATFEHSQKAEELLHYFHVHCKDAVAALGGDFNQQQFLANVDVAVADTFIAHADKGNSKDFQTTLLEATAKYYHHLKNISKEVSCDMLLRKEAVAAGNEGTDPRMKWIVFTMAGASAAPKTAATKTAAVAAVVKPRVLQFDEKLGLPITAQEEVVVVKAEAEPFGLPLRQSLP